MNNYELMLYKGAKYTLPSFDKLHKAINQARFATTTLADDTIQPLKESYTGKEVADILDRIAAEACSLENEIRRRRSL